MIKFLNFKSVILHFSYPRQIRLRRRFLNFKFIWSTLHIPYPLPRPCAQSGLTNYRPW